MLPRGTAASRLHQHVSRTRSKKEEWAEHWVIPLSSATPDHVVSDLERTVAARLGIPLVHRARIPRQRTCPPADARSTPGPRTLPRCGAHALR